MFQEGRTEFPELFMTLVIPFAIGLFLLIQVDKFLSKREKPRWIALIPAIVLPLAALPMGYNYMMQLSDPLYRNFYIIGQRMQIMHYLSFYGQFLSIGILAAIYFVRSKKQAVEF